MMHKAYEDEDRAISTEKNVTLRDLLEPKGTFKSTFIYGRLIALDGFNGKRLFDTRKNKKEMIESFYNARVLSMWPDIELDPNPVYGRSAEPVTKVYLDHNTLHDKRERPTAVPFDFLNKHKCKYDDGSEMYPNRTIEISVAVQTIEDYMKSLGFDDVEFLEAIGRTKEEVEEYRREREQENAKKK